MTRRELTVALLLSCALTTACGKKGPPLAPFVRIPSTPEIAGARRAGNDIYVSVKVPTTNIDASKPASLARIEIYAVTALTPPPRAQFLAVASRIAGIPVAREADPSDTTGTVVPDPTTGALQGSTVTIRDSLTAEAMQPKEVPAENPPRPTTPSPATSEPVPQVLRRFYMTVAFSDRERSSAPSPVMEIPLTMLPPRVPALRASLTGSSVVLEWEPSGGLLGWLFERRLPPEISPVEERPANPTAKTATGELPPGPTTYNVYREIAPDPLVLPDLSPPDALPPPPAEPINATPLSALTFKEEVPFDARRRCYRISAVRGTGGGRVESEPSDRQCVDPVDVEPPTMPTGLTARAMDGVIALSWEPNGELDLRGYLVLRRESDGDTLQRLTPNPISDTRFDDRTVMAGRMYTYVVQAVDTRIPLPNLSDPAEVTETAR